MNKIVLDGQEITLVQLEEKRKALQQNKDLRKIVEVSPGVYKTLSVLKG